MKNLKTPIAAASKTAAATHRAAEFILVDGKLSKTQKSGSESTKTLSLERAEECFTLNEETGVLTNKITRGMSLRGEEPGFEITAGYRVLIVDGEHFRTAHIVWLLKHKVWPICSLDHINRVKTDNRPANLRLSSASMQSYNRGITAGRKYIGVLKAKNRFKASLGAGNVRGSYIGTFDTELEAAVARDTAARLREPHATLNFPTDAEFKLAKDAIVVLAALRDRARDVWRNYDLLVAAEAAASAPSTRGNSLKIGGAA